MKSVGNSVTFCSLCPFRVVGSHFVCDTIVEGRRLFVTSGLLLLRYYMLLLMTSVWLFFSGVDQKGSLPIRTKNTCWTGTTKSSYFAAVPLDFLRKSVVCVFQFAEMCAKFWGLCWNLALNSSLWALKWRTIFSNTAFLSEDIVISFCVHLPVIHALIPQSLQLQVQVRLASRGWCHKTGECVKPSTRISVCFCNQTGRGASIRLLI